MVSGKLELGGTFRVRHMGVKQMLRIFTAELPGYRRWHKPRPAAGLSRRRTCVHVDILALFSSVCI